MFIPLENIISAYAQASLAAARGDERLHEDLLRRAYGLFQNADLATQRKVAMVFIKEAQAARAAARDAA